ncbi:CPBP family glutamic-type intramembrane protease [Microbacterium enclense]|uniref:CPBP family glutamic-type intramembrane protease n=1 Tax=Microbacterium enclense TaxID=993073 RepID=UPI003F805635
MLVGVIFAFARARPAGLLKISPTDLLWGVGCGLLLRIVQGWFSSPSAFPSTGYPGSSVPVEWWILTFVPATAAPLVEEFFFRALILVCVYQILRRAVGPLAAAATALLASAGLFVIVHALFADLSLAESSLLMVVGAVCSALVLLTGRIWSAVIAHLVFNLAFLVLSIAGTVFS